MKSTPVIGRRYVGRDAGRVAGRRGELIGEVATMGHPKGPLYILSGCGAGFFREELTPLSPRKSPPTPPEGWRYTNPEYFAIGRDRDASWGMGTFGPRCSAWHDGVLDPDELVTVAKFLRRLAKWHAQQEKTK